MRLQAALALWIACAVPSFAQDEFDSVLAAAEARFAKFDNRQAAELSKRALALRGNDFHALEMTVRSHHDHGLDLLADGDEKGARSVLGQAREYAKEMERKFPDRAATYFYVAATSGSVARLERGFAKIVAGLDVEPSCRQAIKLDPSFALAHAVLGVFYREAAANGFVNLFVRASPQDAVQSLERAVALDPQLSFARFELAITYETLGDKRAEETFRAILRMNSQTSQDRRNRAIAEQKLRR